MKTTLTEEQSAQPKSVLNSEPSSPDSKDESAELLRLTIPLISKHSQSFAPPSYAVWYEYARGANKRLRAEVDEALEKSELISEQSSQELYQRHIIGAFEKSLYDGRSELLQVLETVDNSVDGATASTSNFGEKLGDLADSMDGDLDEGTIRDHVSRLQSEVSDVRGSMNTLRDSLEASRVEVDRLANELSQAREQARIDALTGLLNRRGFDDAISDSIEALLASQDQHRKPLAMLIFDIDHFKSINDTHGHLFGDKVIQTVAQLIDHGVMRKDHVCRLGGEEFAVIMPETDAAGALAVAERVRQMISEKCIKNASTDEVIGSITVSGGVGIYRRDESPASFVDRTDQALYNAKENGRNQIQLEQAQDGGSQSSSK